jgi:hypothetical protein
MSCGKLRFFVSQPKLRRLPFWEDSTFNRMNENETISAAMSILGSRKSKRKAAAARKNGKLGGRPPISETQRRRALAGKVKGNSHDRAKAKRKANLK